MTEILFLQTGGVAGPKLTKQVGQYNSPQPLYSEVSSQYLYLTQCIAEQY